MVLVPLLTISSAVKLGDCLLLNVAEPSLLSWAEAVVTIEIVGRSVLPRNFWRLIIRQSDLLPLLNKSWAYDPFSVPLVMRRNEYKFS